MWSFKTKENRKGPLSIDDYIYVCLSAFQSRGLQYQYQKRGHNTHFIVFVQSLSKTKYERGKFNAYNIGNIPKPVIIITM